jgi:hypothetical protein
MDEMTDTLSRSAFRLVGKQNTSGPGIKLDVGQDVGL